MEEGRLQNGGIMHFLDICLDFLVIFLLGFLPGFIILQIFTNLGEEEVVCTSFAISFFFYAMVSFSCYLLKIPQQPFAIIATCLLALSLLLWKRTRAKHWWHSISKLVLGSRTTVTLVFTLFFIFCIHALCHQALTPIYTLGNWIGDWCQHYERTLFFFNQGSYFPNDPAFLMRMPLFHLVEAFFLSLLGKNYWTFQIVSTLLNTTFILAIFLLGTRLFNRRVGILCLLFAALNPFILRNCTYTWPKLFSTYYVLLSLYFYLKIKTATFKNKEKLPLEGLLAALFAGLAYMAHHLALFYIIALAIDSVIFYRVRFGKGFYKHLLPHLLLFCVILLPWYVWASSIYGISAALLSNPTIAFPHLKPPEWLYVRAYNTLSTLIPVMLLQAMKKLFLHGYLDKYHMFSGFLAYYWGTLPGALTTGFTIYLPSLVREGLNKVRGFPKKMRAICLVVFRQWFIGQKSSLTLFTILGLIGGICAVPIAFPNGVLQGAVTPAMLLILLYAVSLVESGPQQVKKVITWTISMEFFVVAWSQVAVLYHFLPRMSWDVNLQRKVAQELIFIFDYLGVSRFLFIGVAIAIEFYFLKKIFSFLEIT